MISYVKIISLYRYNVIKVQSFFSNHTYSNMEYQVLDILITKHDNTIRQMNTIMSEFFVMEQIGDQRWE